MRLHQLIERRNKVVADLRALQERADARTEAPGVLTSEEEAQWATMQAEVVELTRQIERAQFLDTEERVARAGRYDVPDSQRQAESDPAGQAAERRDGFRAFLQRGEARALTVGTDSAGGFLVPDEVSSQIIQAAQEAQIIAPRARTVTTMAGTLTLPVASHGAAAWVTEGSSESEADESFAAITLTPYKVKTALAATDELLQDAAQLESYIVTEFARRIAEKEEAAFVNGSGSNQPTGILAGSGLGKTTAGATAITFDEVLDLYGALGTPYVPGSIFLMNPATAVYLMKIKTGVASDNRFIWTASLSADAPGILLGRPVYLSSNMPTIATGVKTILFGDPSYYAIARRPSFSIQRDPYSQGANNRVVFRLFQRVDGKLTLTAACKHLIQA
jgi:HK97 family phage major capsid protein